MRTASPLRRANPFWHVVHVTGDKPVLGGVARRGAGLLATALLATILLATAVRAQQPVQQPPVDTTRSVAMAFEGATVIDVATGRRLPEQTIVVVGNRIQTVGPAGRVRIPAGTRVIRADGTYVIPGLWDMHVHMLAFPNTFLPLFLANGVTGVRDMGNPFLDSMVRWRREIREGRRAGPRLVISGPAITNRELVAGQTAGLPKWWVFHQVGADTPEEGRRVVDSLKRGGADLIKVYSGLGRDVYFAILAEARRVGIPVAGHLPEAISVIEASDSGQHSLEHAMGLNVCGDSTETTPVGPECRALAARLRRNDTWVQFPAAICAGCQLPWSRDQARYHPDSLYDPFDRTPEMPHRLEDVTVPNFSLERWAAMCRALSPYRWALRAGIRLLAGTDAAPFGMFSGSRPGFALHDELWGFVRRGMTPLEALQTATLNPARYLHATDSMGTVAPGKVADFVFLDADPLVDIFNTRRIRAVVADGRFYDRADLDSLLIRTERLATLSRRRRPGE